jgi:hypothetical protein
MSHLGAIHLHVRADVVYSFGRKGVSSWGGWLFWKLGWLQLRWCGGGGSDSRILCVLIIWFVVV